MKADFAMTGLRTRRFIRYVVLYQLSDRLQALYQTVLNALCGGEAIQIEQKRDRHGNLYWWVRDRHSGQCGQFASEQEVRIWLEQRYRGE